MNYLLYSLLLVSAMWLSSGTLFPYAATLPNPIVEPECGYLMNWDNAEFQEVFFFLRGDPPAAWSTTTLLRRILYPALAYFPMQWWGFVVGGFITSVLLHLGAGLLFLREISGSLHQNAQRFLAVALALFPGVAYFGPSPYSYACIVPFSLVSFVLLLRLNQHSPTLPTSKDSKIN